jgi:hypothetical protein
VIVGQGESVEEPSGAAQGRADAIISATLDVLADADPQHLSDVDG